MTSQDPEIALYPLDCANDLPPRHALIALHRTTERSNPRERYHADLQRDKRGLLFGLSEIFRGTEEPMEGWEERVHWRRDALGKPYIVFEEGLEAWAEGAGFEARNLHVSNTHDGARQLLLAVHSPQVAGVGVDIVHLPRLSRPGQDRAYFERFARKFMSETEKTLVQPALDSENVESLRIEIAARFSLMESASKACGTGLKVGLGMGRAESLPMQSLGVRSLSPSVEMLIEGEATSRIAAIGGKRTFAAWQIQGDYLASLVLLLRE